MTCAPKTSLHTFIADGTNAYFHGDEDEEGSVARRLSGRPSRLRWRSRHPYFGDCGNSGVVGDAQEHAG